MQLVFIFTVFLSVSDAASRFSGRSHFQTSRVCKRKENPLKLLQNDAFHMHVDGCTVDRSNNWQTCLSANITTLNSYLAFEEDAVNEYNLLNYRQQESVKWTQTGSSLIFQGLTNTTLPFDVEHFQVPGLYTGAEVFFHVSTTEPNQCCCYHQLDNYLSVGFLRIFGINGNNVNVTYNLYHNHPKSWFFSQKLGRISFNTGETFYSTNTVCKAISFLQRMTLKGSKVDNFPFNISSRQDLLGLNKIFKVQVGLSIITAVNLYCMYEEGSQNWWYCQKWSTVKHPQVAKTTAAIETFLSLEATLDESTGDPSFVIVHRHNNTRKWDGQELSCLEKYTSDCEKLLPVSNIMDLDYYTIPVNVNQSTWSPFYPQWWSCQ